MLLRDRGGMQRQGHMRRSRAGFHVLPGDFGDRMRMRWTGGSLDRRMRPHRAQWLRAGPHSPHRRMSGPRGMCDERRLRRQSGVWLPAQRRLQRCRTVRTSDRSRADLQGDRVGLQLRREDREPRVRLAIRGHAHRSRWRLLNATSGSEGRIRDGRTPPSRRGERDHAPGFAMVFLKVTTPIDDPLPRPVPEDISERVRTLSRYREV